jgi:C-terminal processing protease CtpA/Prc
MKKLTYIVLVISVFAISSCEKAIFEPDPENNPEALFVNLWTTFNTDYAGFEERGVDWDEQYNIYRPQVNEETSSEELKEIITQMLRVFNDGHVSFTTPDAEVFYSNRILDERIDNDLFDLDLIKGKYMQNDFKESGYGGNTYGMMGSIGYLHIAWVGDNMLDMNKILDFFSDAEGLIVDMRHNGGGNFTYAFSEFGRFTDEERFVYRSKTKNGTGPDDYTDWYDWNIYPSAEYFDKPLVLLTDRYTISAGERLVMAYKTLPNLIHLGDTTSGAIATKIGKELANGWYYSLVTQKTEFRNGVNYEGPGIPPDIYVKNTMEEMEFGQDRTLEEALAQF